MVQKKRLNVAMMLRFIVIIFVVFSFFCDLIRAAIEVPQATTDFYVNDFANILSDEVQDYIMQNSEELYRKFLVQLVVVTINSLKGQSIDQYAIALAREWGIGDKESNKGLLILISKQERKVRIEVGRGLEGDFNDAKVGRIIRDCGEELKSDLNSGVKKLYDAVLQGITESDSFSVGGKWLQVFTFQLPLGIIFILLFLAMKKGWSPAWIFVILRLLSRQGFDSNGSSRNDSNRGGGGQFGGGGASGKF